MTKEKHQPKPPHFGSRAIGEETKPSALLARGYPKSLIFRGVETHKGGNNPLHHCIHTTVGGFNPLEREFNCQRGSSSPNEGCKHGETQQFV